MIVYLILFILLLFLELIYFKIADHFNIVDKPNERSSHSRVTLRGGGIVFYFGSLIYFIYSDFSYPWFFIGLSLVAIVSFVDDVVQIRNGIRIMVQFFAVSLIFYELHMLSMNIFQLFVFLTFAVGIINAWNFMDGINGITGGYSMLILGALWYINQYQTAFIANEFLLFTMTSLLVFNIFNFRQKAVCFAGDVGSVSISFIILFCLIKLITVTHNPIYILLLSVYGVDSVLTLVHRLWNKENIFVAHRTHLYQFLSNERKMGHIPVSIGYMVVQFLVIIPVMIVSHEPANVQVITVLLILLTLSSVYVMLKYWILNGKNR